MAGYGLGDTYSFQKELQWILEVGLEPSAVKPETSLSGCTWEILWGGLGLFYGSFSDLMLKGQQRVLQGFWKSFWVQGLGVLGSSRYGIASTPAPAGSCVSGLLVEGLGYRDLIQGPK